MLQNFTSNGIQVGVSKFDKAFFDVSCHCNYGHPIEQVSNCDEGTYMFSFLGALKMTTLNKGPYIMMKLNNVRGFPNGASMRNGLGVGRNKGELYVFVSPSRAVYKLLKQNDVER